MFSLHANVLTSHGSLCDGWGDRMRRSFTLPGMFQWRRVFLVTLAGVVTFGLAAPTAAPATPDPHADTSHAAVAGPPVTDTPETSALRQAQQTGKPVELPGQMTETTEVLVNPNGTFTFRANQR